MRGLQGWISSFISQPPNILKFYQITYRYWLIYNKMSDSQFVIGTESFSNAGEYISEYLCDKANQLITFLSIMIIQLLLCLEYNKDNISYFKIIQLTKSPLRWIYEELYKRIQILWHILWYQQQNHSCSL